MKKIAYLIFLCCATACNSSSQNNTANLKLNKTMNSENKITKTDEEWKEILSPEQYHVLREKGTEAPFSGKYYLDKEKGTYVCAACGAELFKSDTKFDAGCGWPSFADVIDSSKVIFTRDISHGMIRTEVTCAKCGGHLGHVFDDGPAPKHLRYCINSASIELKK